MGKIFLIGILLLFVSIDTSGRTKKTHRGRDKYILVFSDEFRQPDYSQPDTTKWGRSPRGPSRWNRWHSNSKDVVYVKDGCLVCRAIPNNDLQADTAKMFTGAVETLGKFAFQYGKVEVRMKTNFIQGNFPAAWMKPVEGRIDGAYRYGEIDIVEMTGNRNMSSHTVHTHQSHILKKKDPTNFRQELSVTDWHIYGVEWTEDYIMWTVDGKTVGYHYKSNDKQDIADGQWTFDREYYIRLNQSLGNGNYLLTTPLIDQIYETRFDWIRVYQRKSVVKKNKSKVH